MVDISTPKKIDHPKLTNVGSRPSGAILLSPPPQKRLEEDPHKAGHARLYSKTVNLNKQTGEKNKFAAAKSVKWNTRLL